MKKILHIISQKPSDTGSGVYLQNLIANGKENNLLQAIVFACNASEYVDVAIEKERRYKIEFETEKLPFAVLGMSDVMPYRSSVYSELNRSDIQTLISEYESVLKKAILDFEPHVIFCQHLWLLTSTTTKLLEKLGLEIPVYGFCHGTDLRQLILSKGLADIAISGCSKLDKIFALNEFQVDKIAKSYNYDRSNIEVLGNGYNSNYFYKSSSKTNDENKNRIIYAGKISYSKGLISLIRAFKLIDSSKFELYIAGSGHGSEYMEIIEAINAEKNIFYLGKLSQSQLACEFRKSDIFVLPSFYEGLPLVIIEAIACGLRVVCTNINGISKWIAKYIKNDDVISFVDLPSMISIDEPDPREIIEFEKRLSTSILKMSEFKNDTFNNDLLHEIRWKEIFNKLNKYI